MFKKYIKLNMLMGHFKSIFQFYVSGYNSLRPRGYKILIVLNSTEHEIYNPHKC